MKRTDTARRRDGEREISELEQAQANDYLDDLRSSDATLTQSNAVDLLVINFAVTPDEAEEAYRIWRRDHER